MKSIAYLIFFGSLSLSLVVYFNKYYEYEKYTFTKHDAENVYSYKINLNLGTVREFENLPGIGPRTAKAIVNERDTNGRYEQIEDLQRVRGIGAKTFANIKEYLTLEVY